MSKEGWTREQKDEVKLVLESLTIADRQCDKFIADNGYKEWAHCGILDKCVQLLECKVAEWETGGDRDKFDDHISIMDNDRGYEWAVLADRDLVELIESCLGTTYESGDRRAPVTVTTGEGRIVIQRRKVADES